MRRRWVLLPAACLMVLGGVLLWTRPTEPELSFLTGKTPLAVDSSIRRQYASKGVGVRHYSFQGNYTKYLSEVEQELVASGFKCSHKGPVATTFSNESMSVTVYRDIKRQSITRQRLQVLTPGWVYVQVTVKVPTVWERILRVLRIRA